ncbi:dynactin [Panus rudis PR-1116 ss-1]|nr:dynactin [Panus rudis PR-1116 ss-1]
MPAAEISLGAIVDVPAGRGTVRFFGQTQFSPGKWVGIELFEPEGKNNGSVQGVKYFNCKPGHGIFVKPSQVKVVQSDQTPSPSLAPPPTIARPGLGHQRTPSLSRVGSSRSVTSTSSRSASPSKPSLGNTLSPSSPSRPRINSPTKRSPSLNVNVRPPATLRQSTLQSEASSPTVGVSRQRSFDASEKPFPTSPKPSPGGKTALSPPVGLGLGVSRTPPQQFHQPSTLRRVSSPPLDDPPVAEEKEKDPPRAVTPVKPQDDSELQELRAKIRVLEAKRSDDTRHIRELESRLSEAETFVSLRPKLQAKLTSLQTELTTLKRELADREQLSELSEGRLVDVQEQLEMAMLDKEVAEERAELVEAELEEVRERVAMLEVELEVLKGGGADQDPSNEQTIKSSLAYIQLEKQNERLKEALIRLRDISQETEQEQRRRIQEMEKDVGVIDDLQAQYEETLIKLTNAETQIEDLKTQLDDALGAEEMLVQLTERNLELGEKIEEMRITIEDLEALKELNDELEENHVETEKAMQEEINAKDAEIFELTRKIQTLEEACQDYESTIVQFRELVLQLQSELDALRAETQTAQHESATAASQTAAMMSLNLKLQSSASKNQARNIDLEVKRIEAWEARELLGIIQPYLPQIYVESDMDATNCYLFFQRIASKIDLINTFVGQAHNLPDILSPSSPSSSSTPAQPISEVLVGICELRGRLSTLSSTARRFASILKKCDPEAFLRIGRCWVDVAPMEKRVDMHIDLLRREEFRELECVGDAVKMQAQFDHLAETHFNEFDFDLGERELGYALSFDHDLEMFAASVGLIKTSVEAIMKDEDVEVELGGLDPETEFFAPLQKLLEQYRSAKVHSKKLTKRLEDLTHDSAALKPHLIPQLQSLNNGVPELVNFGFSLAQQVMPHLNDVRSSKSSFQLSTVLGFVKQTADATVGKGRKDGVTSWEAVTDFFARIMQEAIALVPLALENENMFKITGTAPWVMRIDQIKAATAINVEAERKVAQLTDELSALARTLREKERKIEETNVKIELMEHKMKELNKKADEIEGYKAELTKLHKQERAYEEAMEQFQADLDHLEQENVKLKQAVASHERQPSAPETQKIEPETIAVEGNLETSYLLEQIDALRNTVRFFRQENAYLKGQDLLREIESLPHLRDPFVREPTPPLHPSGFSDTSDDSDSDDAPPPPTLRTLAVESKLLYRDVIKYTSNPKVVDLSVSKRKRVTPTDDAQGEGVGEGGKKTNGGKMWLPRKKTPAYQVWERKMEGEKLGRRLKGLLERTSAVASRIS